MMILVMRGCFKREREREGASCTATLMASCAQLRRQRFVLRSPSTQPHPHPLHIAHLPLYSRSHQTTSPSTTNAKPDDMCGADCFLMLLSVLFPPIGGT